VVVLTANFIDKGESPIGQKFANQSGQIIGQIAKTFFALLQGPLGFFAESDVSREANESTGGCVDAGDGQLQVQQRAVLAAMLGLKKFMPVAKDALQARLGCLWRFHSI